MRYFLTLNLLLIPFLFLGQTKIGKSSKLNLHQKRVQFLYKRKKYDRCIKIGRNKLSKGNLDRVTYYYLALSCFRLYQESKKSYLLNRSVRYLDYSNFNTNKLVKKIANDDKELLTIIHKKLIDLAKSDVINNLAQTKKNLKYVEGIFNDSTDYLSMWVVPLPKPILKSSNEDTKLKRFDNIAMELTDLFEQGFFNQNSLSEYLEKRQNINIPELDSKVLDFVSKHYGIKEIPGEKHNKQVVNLFHELGFTHLNTDETPWCSAFMNFCAKKNGAKYAVGLRARNWMNCGQPANPPKVGNIVVFGWGGKGSTAGHVGIFICQDGENTYCLGGNQTDEVNITQFCTKDVLGYRKLTLK